MDFECVARVFLSVPLATCSRLYVTRIDAYKPNPPSLCNVTSLVPKTTTIPYADNTKTTANLTYNFTQTFAPLEFLYVEKVEEMTCVPCHPPTSASPSKIHKTIAGITCGHSQAVVHFRPADVEKFV
jgi:hypothetical protein